MKSYQIWFKILNENEKKEIEDSLNEQFGIKQIPGIIMQRGEERLFLFQGELNEKQIRNLEQVRINIERIGVYFAKIVDSKIKLSIEGVHLLQNQITKNIFEVDEKQAEQWMKGQDLLIKTGKRGFIIIKYKDDFLGCGKASEEKIGNYIPKSRRLKERNQ